MCWSTLAHMLLILQCVLVTVAKAQGVLTSNQTITCSDIVTGQSTSESVPVLVRVVPSSRASRDVFYIATCTDSALNDRNVTFLAPEGSRIVFNGWRQYGGSLVIAPPETSSSLIDVHVIVESDTAVTSMVDHGHALSLIAPSGGASSLRLDVRSGTEFWLAASRDGRGGVGMRGAISVVARDAIDDVLLSASNTRVRSTNPPSDTVAAYFAIVSTEAAEVTNATIDVADSTFDVAAHEDGDIATVIVAGFAGGSGWQTSSNSTTTLRNVSVKAKRSRLDATVVKGRVAVGSVTALNAQGFNVHGVLFDVVSIVSTARLRSVWNDFSPMIGIFGITARVHHMSEPLDVTAAQWSVAASTLGASTESPGAIIAVAGVAVVSEILAGLAVTGNAVRLDHAELRVVDTSVTAAGISRAAVASGGVALQGINGYAARVVPTALNTHVHSFVVSLDGSNVTSSATTSATTVAGGIGCGGSNSGGSWRGDVTLVASHFRASGQSRLRASTGDDGASAAALGVSVGGHAGNTNTGSQTSLVLSDTSFKALDRSVVHSFIGVGGVVAASCGAAVFGGGDVDSTASLIVNNVVLLADAAEVNATATKQNWAGASAAAAGFAVFSVADSSGTRFVQLRARNVTTKVSTGSAASATLQVQAAVAVGGFAACLRDKEADDTSLNSRDRRGEAGMLVESSSIVISNSSLTARATNTGAAIAAGGISLTASTRRLQVTSRLNVSDVSVSSHHSRLDASGENWAIAVAVAGIAYATSAHVHSSASATLLATTIVALHSALHCFGGSNGVALASGGVALAVRGEHHSPRKVDDVMTSEISAELSGLSIHVGGQGGTLSTSADSKGVASVSGGVGVVVLCSSVNFRECMGAATLDLTSVAVLADGHGAQINATAASDGAVAVAAGVAVGMHVTAQRQTATAVAVNSSAKISVSRVQLVVADGTALNAGVLSRGAIASAAGFAVASNSVARVGREPSTSACNVNFDLRESGAVARGGATALSATAQGNTAGAVALGMVSLSTTETAEGNEVITNEQTTTADSVHFSAHSSTISAEADGSLVAAAAVGLASLGASIVEGGWVVDARHRVDIRDSVFAADGTSAEARVGGGQRAAVSALGTSVAAVAHGTSPPASLDALRNVSVTEQVSNTTVMGSDSTVTAVARDRCTETSVASAGHAILVSTGRMTVVGSLLVEGSAVWVDRASHATATGRSNSAVAVVGAASAVFGGRRAIDVLTTDVQLAVDGSSFLADNASSASATVSSMGAAVGVVGFAATAMSAEGDATGRLSSHRARAQLLSGSRAILTLGGGATDKPLAAGVVGGAAAAITGAVANVTGSQLLAICDARVTILVTDFSGLPNPNPTVVAVLGFADGRSAATRPSSSADNDDEHSTMLLMRGAIFRGAVSSDAGAVTVASAETSGVGSVLEPATQVVSVNSSIDLSRDQTRCLARRAAASETSDPSTAIGWDGMVLGSNVSCGTVGWRYSGGDTPQAADSVRITVDSTSRMASRGDGGLVAPDAVQTTLFPGATIVATDPSQHHILATLESLVCTPPSKVLAETARVRTRTETIAAATRTTSPKATPTLVPHDQPDAGSASATQPEAVNPQSHTLRSRADLSPTMSRMVENPSMTRPVVIDGPPLRTFSHTDEPLDPDQNDDADLRDAVVEEHAVPAGVQQASTATAAVAVGAVVAVAPGALQPGAAGAPARFSAIGRLMICEQLNEPPVTILPWPASATGATGASELGVLARRSLGVAMVCVVAAALGALGLARSSRLTGFAQAAFIVPASYAGPAVTGVAAQVTSVYLQRDELHLLNADTGELAGVPTAEDVGIAVLAAVGVWVHLALVAFIVVRQRVPFSRETPTPASSPVGPHDGREPGAAARLSAGLMDVLCGGLRNLQDDNTKSNAAAAPSSADAASAGGTVAAADASSLTHASPLVIRAVILIEVGAAHGFELLTSIRGPFAICRARTFAALLVAVVFAGYVGRLHPLASSVEHGFQLALAIVQLGAAGAMVAASLSSGNTRDTAGNLGEWTATAGLWLVVVQAIAVAVDSVRNAESKSTAPEGTPAGVSVPGDPRHHAQHTAHGNADEDASQRPLLGDVPQVVATSGDPGSSRNPLLRVVGSKSSPS